MTIFVNILIENLILIIFRGVNQFMQKNQALTLVDNQPADAETELLCLSDRKVEFKEASERADKSELYVFSDAPDQFGVVNGETNMHYRVNLKTQDAKFYADCECADFTYRRRLCKHIAAVLSEILFG
jgi:hypothetical protein